MKDFRLVPCLAAHYTKFPKEQALKNGFVEAVKVLNTNLSDLSGEIGSVVKDGWKIHNLTGKCVYLSNDSFDTLEKIETFMTKSELDKTFFACNQLTWSL
jgi:plasmid replication initiation protein